MSKDAKSRKVLGTILPIGGAPFDADVVIKEDNTIEHEGMMWFVVPNSTWTDEKKRQRIILPEAIAESLNGENAQAVTQTEADVRRKAVERKFGVSITGSMLAGRTFMNARVFLLFMKMNLLEQLFNLQNLKKWFKQASTWIIAGALLGVILVLVWLVISTGSGFDDLANGLRDLRPAPAPSSSPGATDLPGR